MIVKKKRIARTIPFGYRLSPDNDKELVVVDIEQDAIKEAIKFRQENYPLRSIREWVEKATGRYISTVGLLKIFRKLNVRPHTAS